MRGIFGHIPYRSNDHMAIYNRPFWRRRYGTSRDNRGQYSRFHDLGTPLPLRPTRVPRNSSCIRIIVVDVCLEYFYDVKILVAVEIPWVLEPHVEWDYAVWHYAIQMRVALHVMGLPLAHPSRSKLRLPQSLREIGRRQTLQILFSRLALVLLKRFQLRSVR